MNQFKFSKWSPPISMQKLTLFIMLFEVRSKNFKKHLQKVIRFGSSLDKCVWRLNFLKSLNLSCLVALCKVSFLSSRIWNLFLTSCKWYFLKIFEIFRILASFLTLRNDFLFGVYLKLSPILKTSSQYSICCCDVDKFFLPISC